MSQSLRHCCIEIASVPASACTSARRLLSAETCSMALPSVVFSLAWSCSSALKSASRSSAACRRTASCACSSRISARCLLMAFFWLETSSYAQNTRRRDSWYTRSYSLTGRMLKAETWQGRVTRQAWEHAMGVQSLCCRAGPTWVESRAACRSCFSSRTVSSEAAVSA